MKHKGYNNVINGTDHPYGFGGKEEQDELGLQWMDFHARNYDAALGRWMNIDPLAEDYYAWSPYNYSYNSPILFVDPTGMGPTDWKKNAEGNLVYDENLTKENASTQLKEGESYVGESFLGQNQNGEIFAFGKDGEVSKSDNKAVDYDKFEEKTGVSIERLDITTQEVEKEGVEKAMITMAVSIETGIAADAVIPEPSDAVPQKWVGYAVGLGISAAILSTVDTDYVISTTERAIDNFAHKRKKQSTGKSGSDRHQRQYNQGGKNRPKNPNQRKGAERRRNVGRD